MVVSHTLVKEPYRDSPVSFTQFLQWKYLETVVPYHKQDIDSDAAEI